MFTGMHFEKKKKMGADHERSIFISDSTVKITDLISGQGNTIKTFRLTLHPNVDVVNIEKDILRLTKGSIHIDVKTSDKWLVENGWFSTNYGEKEQTKVLIIKTKRNSIDTEIRLTT